MMTFEDLERMNPDVAETLAELVAKLNSIGQEEVAKEIIDGILIGIEENRKEAEKLEAEETK